MELMGLVVHQTIDNSRENVDCVDGAAMNN